MTNLRKALGRTLRAALAATAMLVAAYAAAQVTELPTTVIGGNTYHYYKVQPKETVYSLCHRLGITHEYMVKCNPDVADGLKAGAILYFPASNTQATPPVQAPGRGPSTHKVQKGETVYGIAHTYGVTVDNLVAANPEIANGLKADQTIIIPAREQTTSTATATPATPKFQGYLVQDKETFYSIARKHGMTAEQLEAINPNVGTLKAGQVLNIPVFSSQPQLAATPATKVETPKAEAPKKETPKPETPKPAAQETPKPLEQNVTLQPAPEPEKPAGTPQIQPDYRQQRVEVAVMLPFMLNQAQDKASARATEFYKGFILALDTLRVQGYPVTVRAYDTQNSQEEVDKLLQTPELAKVNAIIAPGDAKQLEAIAAFGRKHDIKVFNPYVVKDTTYMTNAEVINANIPTDKMLERAADALAGRYARYVPVFLSRRDGPTDKQDFIDAAKEELKSRGVEWKEITFSDRLSTSDLKGFSQDTSYIFVIPTSKQAELNRVLPALTTAKEGWDGMGTLRIFGYPEWITFRGQTLENMRQMGAVVYSRFFAIDDWNTRNVAGKFREYYGTDMDRALPRQGLLGYDTAAYLIPALSSQVMGATSMWLQSPMDMVRDGEGWRNDALLLVVYGLSEPNITVLGK